MTLFFVPVWVIPMTLLVVALLGVLMMILRAHHGLKDRVGTLTPYSEKHADDLQRRVQRIVTVSAKQRETITRSLEASNDDERLRRQADDLDRVTENRKRTKGDSGD